MPVQRYIPSNPKKSAYIVGSTFLFLYWLIGFDGITFSDDVYYLLAGNKFWDGTMEFNEFHFSTRWGAYVPSGLIGFLFGFDPHRISMISLFSYLGTLYLVLKILPKDCNPWVLVTWMVTQVYLLHFLTKVYPDSLLVFWTILIPFSATFRSKKPFLAALGLISGLFFGFLTKETIVFLAPLPLVLFIFDWKRGNQNRRFYSFLLGLGLAFGVIYLGYFWIKFGSPFFHFRSIQEGHYPWEHSYYDKSAWVMLNRLTILPIVTFIERSYWLWIVFAIPGLLKIWRKPASPGVEFGLAFLSMIVLLWFMSTNFGFYNPLYLNPRHLIILIPVLAFLIALGWEEWRANQKLKRQLSGLILFGAAVSLIQQDWKMSVFQGTAFVLLYLFQGKKLVWATGIYLLFPALFAIQYQLKIKQYPTLIETLDRETSSSENPSLILTNNFLNFSKEVLLPENQIAQKLLFPIEKLDSIRLTPPPKLRVFIYDYYRHAYPKEQVDLDALEFWLKENYKLESELNEGNSSIRYFSKN
ncbi:hypothetical protein [Algoriphagus boritolerans]|nr:hypothetical protein [Algoriphagus boritolerans]